MKKYFAVHRIVDEACYPYKSGLTSETGNCQISRRAKSLLDITQCRSSNSLSGRTDLYRTGPAYRISSKENDIKYEIITYGPVQGKFSESCAKLNALGIRRVP